MGITAREPSYSPSYAAAFDPSAGRYGGAAAAAPAVVSVTESSDTTGTNHTVSLPGSPTVGDLLVCLTASRANVTFGFTGFTKFITEDAASAVMDFVAAYRVVDGTETASMTVTTSLSRSTASQVYLISGHDSATNAPEGTHSASTAWNPPGLTPSWTDNENPGAFGTTNGSNDTAFTAAIYGADASTLFICGCTWDTAAGTNVAAAPTNYGDFDEIDDGSGGHAGIATATRII